MSVAATQDFAPPIATNLDSLDDSCAARRTEAREALGRLLQVTAAATSAVAVAAVLVDGDVEYTVATWGIAPYATAKRAGLSPAVPTHPHATTLTGAQLLTQGVVLPLQQNWPNWSFCLHRLNSRWGNRLGVLWMAKDSPQPFKTEGIATFEQSVMLVERELGFLARHEDIIVQREQATLEVAQFHEHLHQQHGLYRELAKHLPKTAVLVFDPNLRVLLNEGWESFASLPHGSPARVGTGVAECFTQRDAPRIEETCKRALQGSHETLEMHAENRILELSIGPLRGKSSTATLGMIVTRDVTEDRKKHEQSSAIGARLHALVQSLDDGILVEDENRRIQVCSNRLCEIMQLDIPADHYSGCDGRDLTSKMASVCFIPEAFEESTAQLVDTKVLQRRELIYLADMRIVERDYSPLSMANRPMGHLWVYRDVTQREQSKDLLQRQADQLRALSLVDELTGLYNRRGFLTLATQQLKLCDRTMRPALVVFVDLDGMKRINDELGHEFGDQALIETANILRHCFRYSDVVSRLGGDEFVALAIDAAEDTADTIQRRLYEKLTEVNLKPDRAFELQFSIGMAPYDPSRAEMVEEVLARADSLMYEQKRARKASRES